RDFHVTGVQTCALPIYAVVLARDRAQAGHELDVAAVVHAAVLDEQRVMPEAVRALRPAQRVGRGLEDERPRRRQFMAEALAELEIGRAPCRERGYAPVV